MKRINEFLNALQRCKMDESTRSYNNISIRESWESYNIVIEKLYNNAVDAITEDQELLTNPTLVKRICETQEKQDAFDIPSKDTTNALLRDYNRNHIQSLKDDFDYSNFVIECAKIQHDYFLRFKEYFAIQKTTENTCMATNSDASKNTTETTSNNDEVIKGTKGFAQYLGIGITKANNILKTRILEQNGVAYRAGNRRLINKNQLQKLLTENPEIFRNIRIKNG